MAREEVRIGSPGLPAELAWTGHDRGLVVFAHGSGSSRNSPRNRYVAQVMQQHGLASLLFDLLTASEGADRSRVFDIDLLSARMGEALDWLTSRPALADLSVGLFGASTGAAAALCAAVDHPAQVRAVVSRGGRVDLAGPCLLRLQVPTLLIVGGLDTEVLELNRQALRVLRCNKRLEVVPGARHLFEEAGTLDSVAQLAGAWFANHLPVGYSR
jgi:putative phosphoribosyl transferase